jgi:DNA-directed RNA polymerase sigma subunit (sigma70/sigma32)
VSATLFTIGDLRASDPRVQLFVLKIAAMMSPRYEAVIRDRLEGRTLKECGELLGVSLVRAKAMQDKVLRKARFMQRQWL